MIIVTSADMSPSRRTNDAVCISETQYQTEQQSAWERVRDWLISSQQPLLLNTVKVRSLSQPEIYFFIYAILTVKCSRLDA